MRRFFFWLAIRAVVFYLLDLVLIHDSTTAFAFFAAFSAIHMVTIHDDYIASKQLRVITHEHKIAKTDPE